MNRMFIAAAVLVVLAGAGSVADAAYVAVDLYDIYPPTSGWWTANSVFPGSARAGQTVADAYGENVQLPRAILYKPGGSAVDLTPADYPSSMVTGTNGVHQFGRVRTNTYTHDWRASVWSGTAASWTELRSGGTVEGSGGGQFVGGNYGPWDNLYGHALLWNSVTANPIDLHPTGFSNSVAQDTNGTQQVGRGVRTDGTHHALLWAGSAASVVDLHPSHLPGITHSNAVANDAAQQVGAGGSTLSNWPDDLLVDLHALLWSGTAGSVVDLNPVGFETSFAKDVNNGVQVGYGSGATGGERALLWRGTAESVVNLHELLGDEFTSSFAYSIDDAGHVFGTAFNSVDQRFHAIEWVPTVPEPAGAMITGLVGLRLLARRRHERRVRASD